MTDKCSREIGYAGFGLRIIAILPESPVKGVHIFRDAGNCTNRHTAANDFSISAQVGFYTKHGLGAARMHPESADHFIKDQAGVGLPGDFPYFFQEFNRLKIRPAALHRFHQYCSELMCPFADNIP